jgi:predicted chitinase
MLVDKALLRALDVSSSNADKFLPELQLALPEHAIDRPLRVAHFLAQVVQESGRMRAVVENMRYSAERLRKVFPTRFTAAQAAAYAGDARRIGSRVYADRLGNGDEVSGDGFRYRGRGLIQLTGKDHYRNFSAFVGEDVMAMPDLVATRYPVRSAVYFWTRRDLNALADADDVAAVTLKVNGKAMRGLAERTAHLDRAKAVLGIGAINAIDEIEAPTHRVSATRLNLRSRPVVSAATRLATLAEGAEVVVLGEADTEGWVRVRARLGNSVTEGVVGASFLSALRPSRPIPVLPPAPTAERIRAAHLRKDHPRATRKHDGARAFALNEAAAPRRVGAGSPKALLDIVGYLDSERVAHQRYKPKRSTTFCNIYAHDYCTLAGVYLPRVWWTDRALTALRARQPVREQHGQTVRELSANSLLDWFEDFGPLFGWKRETCLDVVQAAANQGSVCVIVAQQHDRNRSGHITAVVPEHASHAAKRDGNGRVQRPLESQAGTHNHRFVTQRTAWWAHSRFQDFGFFRHE